MKVYIIIGLFVLLLIAGCKSAPKAGMGETVADKAVASVVAPVDASADVTPVETLDNELNTDDLKNVDAELNDLTW